MDVTCGALLDGAESTDEADSTYHHMMEMWGDTGTRQAGEDDIGSWTINLVRNFCGSRTVYVLSSMLSSVCLIWLFGKS